LPCFKFQVQLNPAYFSFSLALLFYLNRSITDNSYTQCRQMFFIPHTRTIRGQREQQEVGTENDLLRIRIRPHHFTFHIVDDPPSEGLTNRIPQSPSFRSFRVPIQASWATVQGVDQVPHSLVFADHLVVKTEIRLAWAPSLHFLDDETLAVPIIPPSLKLKMKKTKSRLTVRDLPGCCVAQPPSQGRHVQSEEGVL
jgi:hypothetical protein